MSVTYEEALGTLNSMFGHPWTRDHLDSVLRHFEGHMENTVEAVLSHGSGNPDALISKLQGGGAAVVAAAAAAPNTSGDERLARQLSKENDDGDFPASSRKRAPTTSSSSSTGHEFLGTPTQLPPDFLRVPSRGGGGGGGGGGGASDQMLADEALARMLQDDLFTEELANNPEFAHLARGRLPNSSTQWRSPSSGVGGVRTSTVPGPDAPNVLEKLSEMGESAKRSFMLFARNFNDRNKGRPTGETIGQTETKGLLSSGNNVEEEEETYEMKTIGSNGKKLD